MIIAVDFDGTCVTSKYPLIGDELPYCVLVLKALIEKGHKLVLYTMRDGRQLEEAKNWFHERGIKLEGVNHNPFFSTESPKVYANIYIDDCGLGIPLDYSKDRLCVDWKGIKDCLIERGIIL